MKSPQNESAEQSATAVRNITVTISEASFTALAKIARDLEIYVEDLIEYGAEFISHSYSGKENDGERLELVETFSDLLILGYDDPAKERRVSKKITRRLDRSLKAKQKKAGTLSEA